MPRILLVEDHTLVRNVLHDALVAEGHAVTCVDTVAAALVQLRETSYHLLISDVGLPDGSGTTLAASAYQSDVKTILISGHLDDRLEREPYGIYLRKPFMLDDLLAAIRRQLGAETPS